MIGKGWVYIGPDGPTSSGLGDSKEKEQRYQGFAGSNVRMPVESTLLFNFNNRWEDLKKESKVTEALYWEGKKSNMPAAFSVQVYDCVYAIAKAADNWYKSAGCTY